MKKGKDTIKIARAVEKMPPSGIRAFFDLVLGMKDVVSLGVGEPDFVTPWNIREAGIYSLEQGYTSYTSNKGLMELRRDIANYHKRKHGLEYDPEEEILITVGVSEGVDLAFRALIEPGDEILIPEPYYVSYNALPELCGGKARLIKTHPDKGFKISPKDIRRSCGKRTKAMLLNYPNNPTGASYSKAELKDIAKEIERQGLIMLSDEIYGDLTYDYEHVPFATLPRMKERTVYFNGFSKGFAMTGWRIGYVCGPARLIAGMTKIHQYTIMCVPITSQMAAREALKNGERSVQEMKREYMRRREFVVSRLNEMGLSCHKPEGAFYAFPSIKMTGLSSMEFSQRLLEAEKTAVVPGTAFGGLGEGYVRMSYASSFDNLKEAMNRIEHFLGKIRAARA